MEAWFKSWANVRQMHSTSLAPAGKALELREFADGHYARARIVEPTAVKLVEEGVYSAFSVGIAKPEVIRDQKAVGGRVVDGKIVEVSLVDAPANPNCVFQIVKAAGGGTPQYIGKVVWDDRTDGLRWLTEWLTSGDPKIRQAAQKRIGSLGGVVTKAREPRPDPDWLSIMATHPDRKLASAAEALLERAS